MAIVPDLNGSPPGRAGNQVGVDPHNMSAAEYAFHNDGLSSDVSIAALVAGAQQILAADPTRGTVLIMNPSGNTDIAVGIQPLSSLVSKGAHTIFNGNGYTWKGVVARKAFYAYSAGVQALTILVG